MAEMAIKMPKRWLRLASQNKGLASYISTDWMKQRRHMRKALPLMKNWVILEVLLWGKVNWELCDMFKNNMQKP
ncbi:MAG: hypothetical protein OMM_06013 [Candidatus Magnetoglobus multicellularis str. Araruama]|uniref:Uncharacterized protein n=1 Tax=Candidatus Magnetoglobus multicellularis str. Araruama TaxID=890399 RepID=A0A1V1NSJ4_9BACT|nr:MAG: hypothetical protein OMM_06013 [Candidatus Magnetoglobus multicellularis str. Araruama]